MEPLFEFGQEVLGAGIGQPAGGLADQAMDLPESMGGKQGGADGVALATVVVTGAKAIGGEQLFKVLAQGGRLTGEIGPWNRFDLANQVLWQGGVPDWRSKGCCSR